MSWRSLFSEQLWKMVSQSRSSLWLFSVNHFRTSPRSTAHMKPPQLKAAQKWATRMSPLLDKLALSNSWKQVYQRGQQTKGQIFRIVNSNFKTDTRKFINYCDYSQDCSQDSCKIYCILWVYAAGQLHTVISRKQPWGEWPIYFGAIVG